MSALTKTEKNAVLMAAARTLAFDAARGRIAPGYRESTLDFAHAVKMQVGLWGADPDDVLNTYIDEPHDIRALVVAFADPDSKYEPARDAHIWLDELSKNARRRKRTSKKRR